MTATTLAAELAHESKVADLRLAIDLMARKYGDAEYDICLARVTGDADLVLRHRRSSARRYCALQRLTAALAKLAVDGPR